MNIYQSTGAFRDLELEDILETTKNRKFDKFELSAGPFQKDIEQRVISASKIKDLVVHNYFPVPERPFVFNLSTQNKELGNQCIEFAKNAIDLSHKIGSNIYSFHAGFLIDPDPSELGNIMNNKQMIERSKGIDTFFENLEIISDYASKHGVRVMVENNVVSSTTFSRFGCNPLLFAEPEEAKIFKNNLPENVFFLCDYAHLIVSSNSLNFRCSDFQDIIYEKQMGAHLSDNDGKEDQNKKFNSKSWFFEILPKDLEYYSVEVYESDLDILDDCHACLINYLNKDD